MNLRPSFEAARALREAMRAESGPGKLELLERAVRLNDLQGQDDLRFLSRLRLARCAMDEGRPDIALVAMAFCVPLYEKDPERFGEGFVTLQDTPASDHRVAFRFLPVLREVVDDLDSIPAISRDQILKAHAQAERLSLADGDGLRYLYASLARATREMGDGARSAEYRRRWSRCRHADRRRRPECEECDQFAFWLWDGNYDDALRVVPGLLDTGAGSDCRRFRASAAAKLLLPLAILGRHREAVPLFHLTHQAIRKNVIPPVWRVHLTRFLALTGNFEFGWEVARELHRACGATKNFRIRLFALAAIRDLLHCAMAHGGPRELPGPEPEGLSLGHTRKSVPTRVLRDAFWRQVVEITRDFDRRNGNHWITRWAEGTREQAVRAFERHPIRE